MNANAKGLLGEYRAQMEFVRLNCEVFTQVSGKCRKIDFVILDNDGNLKSVSVKSTSRKESGKWVADLRSKTNDKKSSISFDNKSCDILAIYIIPEDRVVLYRAADIKTKTQLRIECL